MGNSYGLYAHPELYPHPLKDPSNPPSKGFKERVMKAKNEEMISAKIPLADRDYCADILINYRACRADTFPFVYKCSHERHEYLTCEYEDYVLRMKQYERERRLKKRAAESC